MDKNIKVEDDHYHITGQWYLHLASYIFEGNIVDKNNKVIDRVDYKIPLSAVVKLGKDYFGEMIITNFIETLKS